MSLQTYLYNRSLEVSSREEYWENNLEMALEMTKGLNYLHSKRIIHRDIKLHNILLNDSYDCKIIDFGLARKAKFWKSSIEERQKQGNSLTEED